MLISVIAWDVKLWDIYPTCQVAGVGQDDTVIIVCYNALLSLSNLTDSQLGRATRRQRTMGPLLQSGNSQEGDPASTGCAVACATYASVPLDWYSALCFPGYWGRRTHYSYRCWDSLGLSVAFEGALQWQVLVDRGPFQLPTLEALLLTQ